MYLSQIRLWNFRKYGERKLDAVPELSGAPGLDLILNPDLNLLVGENDSGKTAIVDAIKLVLLTQSREYIRITRDDFYLKAGESETKRCSNLKIECTFRGFTSEQASHFLEWLGIEKDKDGVAHFVLRVTLSVRRKINAIIPEVRAGMDSEGSQLTGDAKELLRLIYLKPLRDAEHELAPSKNSRLSQILESHPSFRDREDHPILETAKSANSDIGAFFEGRNPDGSVHSDLTGQELVNKINEFLLAFFGSSKKAGVAIADAHLKAVLEKLNLQLDQSKAGLGAQNLLFIAAELLLLQRSDYSGLKLALIEEIEAHLHPQAQLRLIKFLQQLAGPFQLIVTTHSPNLASEVPIENLIICRNNNAFPMGSSFTKLRPGDYLFLERFLDVTKANLFFARGVIIVEGDGEALLLPTIANIIGFPLTQNSVSVINLGNKAFIRYASIFKRRETNDTGLLDIKVSVVTDSDVVPQEWLNRGPYKKSSIEGHGKDLDKERDRIKKSYDGQNVKTFVTKAWTLEYDLASSQLRKDFYRAILYASYIKNSPIKGLTDTKVVKADQQVEVDLNAWETKYNGDPRIDQKIAFEIYNSMLKIGQLKAITAQCFALILEQKRKSDQKSLSDLIEKDPFLEYIVQAIKHASSQ